MRRFRMFTLSVLLLFLSANVFVPALIPITNSLSPEQVKIFKRKIPYFDVTFCQVEAGVYGSSEGGPLTGVRFPKVADKALLAKAINDYIKDGWPGSPLVGYGDKYVANGEKYDVNPLVSVVISQVEYQFGTVRTDLVGPGGPGQYNFWAVTHNSNASTRFGAYPSIDVAMEEHFKLLGGPLYLGPPSNFKTISQIMNRYAPAFENNTAGYINTIVKNMKKILKEGGVTADEGSDTEEIDIGQTENSCVCSEPQQADQVDVDAGNIQKKLSDLANENGGRTAISVMSIDGKIDGNANGSDQMPTRSSYKLYTAYATLRAIEAGRINWTTRVSNGGWSGTVERTMEAMIVNSNNDAAASLRLNSTIGTPRQVTNLLQNQVGLSNKTVMGSGGTTNSNSVSTANDFVKFLVKLEKKELPGVTQAGLYDKLVSFMKRATTDGTSARQGIVAGVKGAEVADKPGWASGSDDPASNDVGIVYLRERPYAVAILTDKPNKWDGVATIAGGVHSFMGGNSTDESCSGGAADGSVQALQAMVKLWAWPTYSSSKATPKPAYKKALDAARAKGLYIGGGYTDCGGFVTNLMIASGFEPNYNYSGKGGDTISQKQWLEENWQKVNASTVGNLQPGDVGISDSHTFLYVGKIAGFNDVFASASLHSRTPMAGQGDALSGKYTFYRKK